MRRLPSFLLSQFHHRVKDGRLPQLPSPDEMCRDYMPDFYIRHYTDEGRLVIQHWLRSEVIRDDLSVFLARHFDLTAEQEERIQTAATKTTLSYEHDTSAHFAAHHLAQMYATNPLWAEMERQVYGDTPAPV